MQNEITKSGDLLNSEGKLAQVGWARQQNLDCNLENANFYALKFLQKFRIKRWDYYGVFTPNRYFSATIADLGYAGNIFVYTIDFESKEMHEEGIVIPLGKGITLPRNSASENSYFSNKNISLEFIVESNQRKLIVSWPGFHNHRGIEAEISLAVPDNQESMNIVIPIKGNRFYYNRKINCLPASGSITYDGQEEILTPDTSIGSLDWGRGVWEYSSFWQWASASGFHDDGRTIGLNMGGGFGDTSQATENAFILGGVIHKLDQVSFEYDTEDYMKPWRFKDNQGRIDLIFTPFKERVAQTNLGIIFSEVHQIFGRYSGEVICNNGEKLEINDLIGFAEDHIARW